MALHTMSGKFRGERAFTLIELLVVMVIIASLLAIAAPRYFRSLDRAKEVVLTQDLAVMREAIDYYYGDRAKYPESLQDLVEERYLRSLPVDPITKSSESWVLVLNDDPDIGGIQDVTSGAEGETSSGVRFVEL
jgi:general secretion pathway protein G